MSKTHVKDIEINDQSIKNRLHVFNDKPASAILEYIWNGFDANADNIFIQYSFDKDTAENPFGYADLEISDDGDGWNVKSEGTANLFLVSSKEYFPYKSLPQGREGVGRFAFYSFATKAIWETTFNSRKFRLVLEDGSLNKFEWEEVSDLSTKPSKGTKVSFQGASGKLTESFFKDDFIPILKQEFCWFLRLYPGKNIYINKELLDISDLIRTENEEEINISGFKFDARLVQWRIKPAKESSKYYFLDEDGLESFKKPSGLNNQSDDFFHSVYIKSDFFNDHLYWEQFISGKTKDEQVSLLPEPKEQKDKKEVYQKLVREITKKAELMRRPYLKEISGSKIEEWKRGEILPNVTSLGIDQEDYEELIKEVYVVVPKLLSDSSEDQKKVILRFFSSLMSTEERGFILKILEEVYKLSEEDRESLKDLLQRTTVSNIIKTLKEIDHRLEVLNSLEEIILNGMKNQSTKEVLHLQKILDENVWVFGEGYRLFASTEGAINKTLKRFKDDILRKPEEKIKTKSRKELDIFLTKFETTSEMVKGVVIEIKRPSITLGKKELDQIKEYMDTVLDEPACNGDKMRWTFYLIGCDYNEKIKQEIETNKNWGESNEGLVYCIRDSRVKLYVKKWTDIINVDQRSKYLYLQEKLKLETSDLDKEDVPDIVAKITRKNI